MSHNVSSDLLMSISTQMLEESAFVFCEEIDEPWSETDPLLQAMISLHGGRRLSLVLTGAVSFATALAANILGVDLDDLDVNGSDALGEMANMIGGSLVEHIREPGASDYTVGLPSLKEISFNDFLKTLPGATCSISLLVDDEHRLEVSLFAVDDGSEERSDD